MGFASQLQSESSLNVIFVEGKIVALERFDAYLAPVVTWFSDDARSNGSGHCQKPHHNTFASFLSKTHNKLFSCIKIFIEVWCAEELRIWSLSFPDAYSSDETCRAARMEIYVPSEKRTSV